MKANETKFQPIIEGTRQYIVPLFQRPYSWEQKQWKILWEDLLWLCENDEPKSYFIGSIVTMPTNTVPEGIPKFLLIDGQQRLTTIFILLTLIRDLARQRGMPELAQEIEETMLVNRFKKGEDYFKLLPTQTDRQAFKSLINNETFVESKIGNSYRFFERILNQQTLELETLHKVIVERLSVVSITLDRDDNPHLVFESLNAKGEPLTQADLIRNYFFMRFQVDRQDAIHATHWQPMQDALGENLTESIRHYLMRDGNIIKKNDEYFVLKDRADKREPLEALQEVVTFSGYYKKFLNPETESDAQLREALSRLKRLDVTVIYPFLLNCYHEYATQKIPAQELLEIFQAIENFIIRRFVCNIPTHGLNKIFPILYKQASDESQLRSTSLPSGVKFALQSRGYPIDREFGMRLKDAKLYGGGDRSKKTKFILESLESSFGHKEQTLFDNLTIEHIMPQTPSDWWQINLGENWQVDHDLFLDTLGNLTLTAYNSELSNAPFERKKQILEQSHIELNRYFQDVQFWNREEIDKRSQALTELAFQKWAYFGEEESVAESEDVTGKKPLSLTILKQSFVVKTWKDVLVKTFEAIAEIEPDLFNEIPEKFARLVNKNETSFRSPAKLQNDYFVETNLSAKDIHRFCLQAIETIGLSKEDWSVEID